MNMPSSKSIAILASWSLTKVGDTVYIPNTHHIYLTYVTGIYDKVYLISPMTTAEKAGKASLMDFRNVEIIPLPYAGSFVGAFRNWRSYKDALKKVVEKVDFVYSRVPDPFSWMPALLFKKKTVMHFVGDTIDATQHNEKWSWLKKKVMIAGYMPDYWLTLRAARRSRVFTNGTHLVEKLAKYGVKAIPVVSSTVFEKDLHDDFRPLPLSKGLVSITYIGYVRYAKGMHCLMDFCKQLNDEDIKFRFHLIGDGEMLGDVKSFLNREELTDNVILHGHIDNREEMNAILRSSDIFFFPSLSEGSPRVVIEAMAQGTPVISTPVGSLPGTFEDGKTIRFFNFNDSVKAVEIVKSFMADPIKFEQQRRSAYQMVADNFTIEKFLSKVFSCEA